MEYKVRILSIHDVTHDVKCFRFEKPPDYQFNPGQATDVSINKPGWENEIRPFTFTSLNENPVLEFTIKRYADHHGVTDMLHQLQPSDELIIRDIWGAIEYKGPGYFIAGGAGITPFVAILRQLHKENRLTGNILFFSNKTVRDIIYEQEFTNMLGRNAHYTLTQEKKLGYDDRFIDESFLKKEIDDFQKHFYICGPDKMVSGISDILNKFGAKPDAVVFEK